MSNKRKRNIEESSGSEDSDRPIKKVKKEIKTKSSEESIRNERLERGAILLRFEIERPDLTQAQIDRWRDVEKKGFFVTEKGCLIPADCHLFKNRSKKVAYDLSMAFFYGKERDLESKGKKNHNGWDCEENISHLCHRNSCCCYRHLELVPRWKNLRRNYCGDSGECDCGSENPCVDVYHPISFVRKDTYLTYSTKHLKKKLDEMYKVDEPGLKVRVKILPRDHYFIQDKKRDNRNKRKKASKENLRETKKKEIKHSLKNKKK